MRGVRFILFFILQRKSSSPKTPPSKRQRRQTKKFEFPDEIPRSASGKKTVAVEVAFDKGSWLAIRADGGKKYISDKSGLPEKV